ncbi:MAG: 23S rRNA (guanosine(2251)-2'-O)-methyltransferase RlmB [Candidatus Magasanikbacteria bacterium]|nr:23S rRNA (guanosine(2251)-2'-O)-methyltransferase RlmB [Candidatus Magasanikbacteria bacterium]
MLKRNIKKHINKLHQKKYRKEYAEFIIEGIKGVGGALESNSNVNFIVIEEKKKEDKNILEIIKKAEGLNIEIHYCAQKDIGDIKTTETFPGILAVIKYSKTVLLDIINDKPIICLDSVKDPGNLGTIIRTADWFGLPNILLSENCVDVYNEKTVRSTMGSIFHTGIYQSQDIVSDLKNLTQKDYSIVSLTMDGENLKELQPKKNNIYVFGSESHGVRSEIIEMGERYTIPGKGNAESLNVAVSAGIVLKKIVVQK